tara:strand:+ start:6095 stop:6511 length:417 start_codon:yes stop_codon:yes gene_type:complete
MLRIITRIPSAALSPNSRSHWRVKHKASKVIKEATAHAVQIALRVSEEINKRELPWHEIELQAVYYHHCNRRRDPDNLIALLKYPIDGLVLGGLLVDDDQITLKPVIRLIDKDNPRLEMTITPLRPILSEAASEEPKQ